MYITGTVCTIFPAQKLNSFKGWVINQFSYIYKTSLTNCGKNSTATKNSTHTHTHMLIWHLVSNNTRLFLFAKRLLGNTIYEIKSMEHHNNVYIAVSQYFINILSFELLIFGNGFVTEKTTVVMATRCNFSCIATTVISMTKIDDLKLITVCHSALSALL